MTIKELIKLLERFPPDTRVYREGGQYKDDLRELQKVEDFRDKPVWGIAGILLE